METRITASAAVGSITGSITNVSSGATSEDITVTGTVNPTTPTLNVSANSLDLGTTTTGTAGTPQDYTIGGTDLTNNVLIVAPTNVELSDNGGTSWSTVLTLIPTSGTVATTTVEARITAAAGVGSISGSITNASTGASEMDITVTGSVIAVPPTLTVSPSTLTLGTTTTGTPGTPADYDISGVSLTNNVVITAPTGVELSDNSGTTWNTTLTLTPSSGTLASTQVEARIQATASVGSITGSINNTSVGALTQNVAVTGTVNAVTPTLTVSVTSLNLGTTTTGTAGTPEDYDIGGSGLTNNVIITPPTGVELSDDSGVTWHTSLTLTPTGGSLSTVPAIEARIQAAAGVGSITGSITNVSTGATEQDISVTGTVDALTPTLTVDASTLDLGTTTAGTAGTPSNYDVSGTGLTNNVIITAPTGVELSDDSGTTWDTTLTLTPSSGTVASTQIDARIQASASVGTISGSITNVSTGATEQDITVSGTVNAVAPSLTVDTSSVDLGTTTAGIAGTPADYDVSGANLTNNVIITAPTSVELSDDSGSTWSTSLTLTPTSGTLASTEIEARIQSTASVGAVTGSITNVSAGATEQDVAVSGTVDAAVTPTLTVDESSLDLGTTTAGTAGTPADYNVSGTGLTNNVIITAPTGVELSSDSGAAWSTSLTLTPSSGNLALTAIEARIQAAASAGTISGSITNDSTGATEQDVAVSGTVNPAPALSVDENSLDLGTTTEGTAGTPADYDISGVNLTNNVIITAPTGVELSDDSGNTWDTSLTLIPASGTLASTQIEARIQASAPVGSLSGTITNVSTGAVEQDITVSGDVGGTVNPAPSITIDQTSLDLGTTPAGTAGTAESYDVSGANLTNNVVITAPTGVELSDDSGNTWNTSLTLTPTSGTLASTPIEARIQASAAAGPINGSIANTSTNAIEQDVSVSGHVTQAPTITVDESSLDLGTTTSGTAGEIEVYNLSGSALTNNVVVTAPTGVELSDDGGSNWSASLTLTPTSGTVVATPIDVRIAASASPGSISGSITNDSIGAMEQDITVTGTVM